MLMVITLLITRGYNGRRQKNYTSITAATFAAVVAVLITAEEAHRRIFRRWAC